MTHHIRRPDLKLTEQLPEVRIITPGEVPQTPATSPRTAGLWAAVTILTVAAFLFATFVLQAIHDGEAEDRIAAASRTQQGIENAELQTQLAAAETRLDDAHSAISQLSAQIRELQRTTGLPQRRIVIPPPAPRATRTTAPRTIPIPPALPTPAPSPHPQWSPLPSPSPGPSLELCAPLPGCVLPTPLVSVLPGPSAS